MVCLDKPCISQQAGINLVFLFWERRKMQRFWGVLRDARSIQATCEIHFAKLQRKSAKETSKMLQI
jgi:hypothetical protein